MTPAPVTAAAVLPPLANWFHTFALRAGVLVRSVSPHPFPSPREIEIRSSLLFARNATLSFLIARVGVVR
jgi:hypothetical protein